MPALPNKVARSERSDLRCYNVFGMLAEFSERYRRLVPMYDVYFLYSYAGSFSMGRRSCLTRGARGTPGASKAQEEPGTRGTRVAHGSEVRVFAA